MSRRARGSVVQRPNGRWYVRVTHEGKRTTRGSWATRGEAEGAVPATVAAVVRDRALVEIVRQERTLGEFLVEYEALLRTRVAASTAAVTLGQIRAAAAWVVTLRGCWMREVSRTDAEDYVVHLLDERRSSTVKRHLDSLSVCWDVALERGFVDDNPWRGHRLTRAHERVVPWISPDDLLRLVSRTRQRHRGFVLLLAETGLRKSEAYGLEWGDVDLIRRTLLVRRSKSRRLREVPLLDASIDMLSARRTARVVVPVHGPDLVFEGLPCKDLLRQDLDEACELAKVPRLRVHDLRHVYASHLVRAGVPVPTVAALLGHQDGGALVLRRYGRWAPDDAAERAAASLAAMRDAGRTTARRRRG